MYFFRYQFYSTDGLPSEALAPIKRIWMEAAEEKLGVLGRKLDGRKLTELREEERSIFGKWDFLKLKIKKEQCIFD